MPTGKGFTPAERQEIDKAIRNAELICRFEFSLYVGPVDRDAREYAKLLHATLVAPKRSVMIVIDPAKRELGIVTGAEARRELTDQEVELVVAEMRSDFAAGDLVGGIKNGIVKMAEHARKPVSLHTR